MAQLTTLTGKKITLSPDAFVAPNSQIIGNVEIKAGASIWYNTVLRGDVMPITIGADSNIQDGTIVHGTTNRCGVTVDEKVTVGHSCVLHGCHLYHHSFVGMGSIVMDLCEVVPYSMLGAGSLLSEKTVTKEGWLYLGRPAKPIRKLRQEEIDFIETSAQNYMKYQTWYKELT